MFTAKDPRKNAIDELMKYLDGKDGEELGEVVKPKPAGIEVAKIEKIPGEDGDDASKAPGSDGDEPMDMGASDESDKSGMSDEEISELIEALQQKLSC